MTINEKLIYTYKNSIIDILGIDDRISVSVIHRDTKLCFNHSSREVLYAIKQCLGENNCEFRESMWGKALSILLTLVPKNPPFETFISAYKFHFDRRLSLLEEHFDTLLDELPIQNKNDMNSTIRYLKDEKERLFIKKDFNYELYVELRNKYQEIRLKLEDYKISMLSLNTHA